jgi:hypothetical protein
MQWSYGTACFGVKGIVNIARGQRFCEIDLGQADVSPSRRTAITYGLSS